MRKPPWKLIIALCLAAITAIALTVIVHKTYFVVQTLHAPMFMNISHEKAIGLKADTDALHFGVLPPGAKLERYFGVTNTFDFPVKAQLETSGTIAQYVSVSENEIRIPPKETRQITVQAHIRDIAPEGEYTGVLTIILRR